MDEVAVYIHIPFCKQKCFYCDFPSFCNIDYLMKDYIEALGKEIKATLKNKIIKTIFIGGGTPTYLNSSELRRLSEFIRELDLTNCIEFTMEGNPGTFTKEKLEIIRDMGVNRLSIGLQATQDSLLKKIGRIHSFEEFQKSYALAREIGFKNINVDLIFGLPSQTMEMWLSTLKKIIDLNVEHMSCYSLIVEEGTPFYNLYNEKNLPEEELVVEMYEATKELLKKAFYCQYEISNYSKKGYECKHNLVYWELKDYIGVGASAHSYYKDVRYRNEADVKKYIEAMNKRETAVVETIRNSIEDDMEEFMFLGLRKIKGILIKEFKEKFNKDIYDIYKDVIEKHKKNKLLIEEEGRLYLSAKGIEVSNYVLSDFII